MKPIWPFRLPQREAKAAVPLVALSEIGTARWGARDGAALSTAIANDIVDGVLDTGRKLLAAEANGELGQN